MLLRRVFYKILKRFKQNYFNKRHNIIYETVDKLNEK